MPIAGTGLAGRLGFKRRDDPAAYQKAWNAEHREKLNAYHRAYYNGVTKLDPIKVAARKVSDKWAKKKSKYGLDKDTFKRMLTDQEGKCMICNIQAGEALCVDHDHETGAVRGLLCTNCNLGLGAFKDDQSRLAKAIQYLTEK